MSLRSSGIYCGVVATSIACSAQLFAAEIERIEWAPVPGASFYVGTMEDDGIVYQITTPSTWIMTGKGTVKKIDAWTPNGPLKTKIEVLKKPLSEGAGAAVIEPTPPALESEETTPSEPEEGPQDSAEDEAPVQTEQQETPAEQQETPEPEDTTTFSNRSRVTVSIGMGKEWITSEVGISKFQGGANIGGTILDFCYGSTNSSLWYDGEFSAHNFTTETAKTDAATTSTKEEKNSEMRFRVSVFYNLFQEVTTSPQPVQGLSLGGGIAYLKHPLLAISNGQTGAASMQSKSATSLDVGVRYGRLLSYRNLLEVGADSAPFSISKDVKTMSTSVFADWIHLITPNVYTNLGTILNRDQMTHSDTCPSVTNCKKEGSTTSDLLQFRMGVSAGF